MSGDEAPKSDLISYRLARARETLLDARLLSDEGGSPASVLNRAYYAMFYAVLALLITTGQGTSKHSGVLALFDKHFVRLANFQKK